MDSFLAQLEFEYMWNYVLQGAFSKCTERALPSVVLFPHQ